MIGFGSIVEVLELAWTKTQHWDKGEIWTAPTVFCDLKIVHWIETPDDDAEDREEADHGWQFEYSVCDYYDQGCEPFDTFEAAKARAEVWYLQRITPALKSV